MPDQEFSDGTADFDELRRRLSRNRVTCIAVQMRQRRMRNGPGRLLRVVDGVVEVQVGNEQQRGRLDRSQRSSGLAAKPGSRSDVVRVVGPALIDPLERIGAHF
jgi:hypothetical protein